MGSEMCIRDSSTYDIAKLGEVEAEILGRGKTHEAVPTGVVRASYNNNRLPCAVIFSEAPQSAKGAVISGSRRAVTLVRSLACRWKMPRTPSDFHKLTLSRVLRFPGLPCTGLKVDQYDGNSGSMLRRQASRPPMTLHAFE